MHSGYRWQLVRASHAASPAQAGAAASHLESSAASDKGSDSSHEPSSSQHSRLHSGTAGEVDRLRTTLRQKEDQVASLRSQLTNLEATRDRYVPLLQHLAAAPLRLRSCGPTFATWSAQHFSVGLLLMVFNTLLL